MSILKEGHSLDLINILELGNTAPGGHLYLKLDIILVKKFT